MWLWTSFSCPIVRSKMSVFLPLKFSVLMIFSVQKVAELPGSIKTYVSITWVPFLDLIFTGTMAKTFSFHRAPVYPHVSCPTALMVWVSDVLFLSFLSDVFSSLCTCRMLGCFRKHSWHVNLLEQSLLECPWTRHPKHKPFDFKYSIFSLCACFWNLSQLSRVWFLSQYKPLFWDTDYNVIVCPLKLTGSFRDEFPHSPAWVSSGAILGKFPHTDIHEEPV